MKFNRILSTVIIFVMLFTSMVAVFPVGALAAENAGSGVTVSMKKENEIISDADKVKAIAQEYLKYNFKTAEEMLDYELDKGYLVSAATKNFTVYVNVYTGFVYYKNNLTGQILTSNPIDPAYQTEEGASIVSLSNAVMSQIELSYTELANTSAEVTYDSLTWIMNGSLLSVSEIEGKGISVEYTLGEASASFISPVALLYDTFVANIANPMFAKFADLIEAHCGAFDKSKADSLSLKASLTSYNVGENDVYDKYDELRNYDVVDVTDSLVAYAEAVIGNRTSAQYQEISKFSNNIKEIFNSYTAISNTKNNVPPSAADITAVKDGKTVYILTSQELNTLRGIDKAIRAACPGYTLEMVGIHQEECGYEFGGVDTPTFRCRINYTLDENGILTVDIPVSPDVLTFNASLYSLSSFTPLKHFGAGDMDNDGYIFYPDGSGTVVEFEDFYYGSNSGKTNTSIYVDSSIYGTDFVYSEISGAHREQITMPVYGLVNDVNVNASTDLLTDKAKVTNGFFTVIEEGATSATLCFATDAGSHKYASVYTKLKPYPSDKLDLSQTLSVSGLGYYYVVAETGYQGSYKFRVNMLTDEDLIDSTSYGSDKTCYPADYTGMASCYRDYLIDKGEIEALKEFSEDLPLYLEALGSIDITQRILTFPVTVSTALTTFDDVENIYKDLSDITDSIEEFKAKAEEYLALANEKEKDETPNENDKRLVREYREKAAAYTALANKIQNITNINFKLTGFANGGMYFTYPAKVRWEGSVGGNRGFKDLLSYAKEVNSESGKTLGIYPDFDFLFINNTAAFDGITPNGTAARMVDNRFASKQAYDSIQQKYESLFALVVSADSLDGLYNKFQKKYSKFEATGLSVSTLGSTVNSNMDEKNLVNREDSLGYITALLGRMKDAEDGNYSLMTDVGNIYSVKYADHILNASIDSSHFRYSSFTVPFYGMVLHGYVNYAGSPLNYSGSPDYDLLRSIESGASLYYILCCSNTNYLKEDKILSDYYGIDYSNWEEKILEQYYVINNAVKDLQKYNITDHDILACERLIDADELYGNYERLAKEVILAVDNCISAEIDRVIKDTKENDPTHNKSYYVTIDKAGVLENLSEVLSTYADEALRKEIYDAAAAEIRKILADYEAKYNWTDGKEIKIGKETIKYTSKYSYVTESVATDRDNYKHTDFTCDNGSVVMVTYSYTDAEGKTDEVVFLLNYNTFAVEIIVDNTIDKSLADGETKTYTLGEYGCHRIDSTGDVKIK